MGLKRSIFYVTRVMKRNNPTPMAVWLDRFM
jgi:hypothetical protein